MPEQDVAQSRGRDRLIDAFRADIDATLLEENLRLSVEQRFLRLMELQRFAQELQTAGRRARPL